MDDVPLKLLFGVSNLNARRRASKGKKKKETNSHSSKVLVNSSNSARSKVKESLASVLEIDVQQQKDYLDTRSEHEVGITEKCLDAELHTVETADIHFELATDADCNGEQLSNALKQSQDFMQKPKSEKDANDTQMGRCLKTPCRDISEEYPHKRIKVVKEESDVEAEKQIIQISDQAQTPAGQVEAELFKLYGGINKEYTEKVKSLVDSLKGHTTSKLRGFVLSGEITPDNLCCMTAEQLVSYESSKWSVTKDEELRDVLVMPNSDIDEVMVKKVDKIEFQGDVQKDDSPLEVIVSGGQLISGCQVKQEVNEVNEVASLSQDAGLVGIMDNHEIVKGCSDYMSSNNSLDQAVRVIETKLGAAQAFNMEPVDDKITLPAIVSLNEFMKFKEDQSNDTVKADTVPYNKPKENRSNDSTKVYINHKDGSLQEKETVSGDLKSKWNNAFLHKHSIMDAGAVIGKKINAGNENIENLKNELADSNELQVGKQVKLSPDEKLWEGCLQLNAYITVMAIAFFKSGGKARTNNWSKLVEVKGRVRLDAFEKFLQELPLSRNRALMVISICWKVGSPEAGLIGMQEIANSYKQGERVGFAELAPGVDLYVCPPDETMVNMLIKYGFIKNLENANKKQEGLIGCVVWRRHNVTSNVTSKTPEQYVNAHKLALSGQLLDSPSHPGVSQFVSHGNHDPVNGVNACLETISSDVNTRSDMDESRLQTVQSPNQIVSPVACAKAETEQNTAKDAASDMANFHGHISRVSGQGNFNPGFSPPVSGPYLHDPRISTSNAFTQTPFPRGIRNDDPTGEMTPSFGLKASTLLNSEGVKNQNSDDDDDDLPEFDFTAVSGTSQTPVGQILPPCNDVRSLPLHQFSFQPSTTVCNQSPLQLPVSSMSSQRQLGEHQNKQQISRHPIVPYPSVQVSNLVQWFGQNGNIELPSVENCRPKVPQIHIASPSCPQPSMPNLQHATSKIQNQCPSTNEVRKSLWDDDDDDIPEWCPPYLEQHGFPGPPMPAVPPDRSAMPVQSSPLIQPGTQTLIRNLQPIHPQPPRGPPPRGPSPQGPPPLRCPPPQGPTLPQGHQPPLPPGPHPSKDNTGPIPRPITQSVFHSKPSFRPFSKPDFSPIRPVEGRGKKF